MKNTLHYILALLLCAGAIRADDITLTDGKTVYRNAKIVSYDAASVTIKHSTGIARVMITDLPKELRDKLNYDPTEAKKLLEKERTNTERTNTEVATQERARLDLLTSGKWSPPISSEEWKKRATRITGTLFQVTDDGVLIHLAVGGQLVFVKHVDSGQFVDGDTVTVYGIPCAPYRYTNTQGGSKTVRAFDAAPPSW